MSRRLLLSFFFLSIPLSRVSGHTPSDAYLALEIQGQKISGQWDVGLKDLEFTVGLDEDGDGAVTWGELKSRHQEIQTYLLPRLKIKANGLPCPITPDRQEVEARSENTYTAFLFSAECPEAPETLQIEYRLFYGVDAQHRGFLSVNRQGRSVTAVLDPAGPEKEISLGQPGAWRILADFIREGIHHIWIGYDHIAFLLVLIFPAVLTRRQGHWEPARGFKTIFIGVLKVVTAFTIAHSITLSLAVLKVATLPGRLVESVIAASIVVGAALNLFPKFHLQGWVIAFTFGLIHGFGFASVLNDLGLPQNALLLSLLGFNLGVEIGQLAIVAAFLPVAYRLRNTSFYRVAILWGGSSAVALLGLYWFVERAF